MRQRLAALSNFEGAYRAETVTALPQWKAARVVLLYVPMRGEFETASLDAEARQHGRMVAYPRVESVEPATMCVALTSTSPPLATPGQSRDDWLLGVFGCYEPSGPALDPGEIDFALVPGLAFTKDGSRLGRGKGYYDRFLASLRTDCFKCGIGHDFQLVDNLPAEPHDVPLDAVATPTRVYRQPDPAKRKRLGPATR